MAEQRIITKQLAGVEDLLLDASGNSTVTQKRGLGERQITKINTKTIPHKNADGTIGNVWDAVTHRVDTISDFKAMIETPKLVYVTGYHTKDDGAFGSHIFKLREGATPDGSYNNDGTIIETANGVYDLQYDGAVNVKWFGAKGDGITDDTEAIQKAVDFAADNGIVLFWSAGIYSISSPINMQSHSKWTSGTIVTYYHNFSTDWQTAIPSYGTNSYAVLQYVQGSHGALINPSATGCTIEGLIFRCGQVRTSDDVVFSDTVNHINIQGCVFQNLSYIVYNISSAYGAWSFSRNIVTGCTMAFGGVLVDMRIFENTFTSLTSDCIYLTQGSGYNLIEGNRFEFGNASAIKIYKSRNNNISGNIFDAFAGAAINIIDTPIETLITGNTFTRNGYTMSSTYGKRSHIYIKNSSVSILNNMFKKGTSDSGGDETPLRCIETESLNTEHVIEFLGNSTREACTSSLVFDTMYSSANVIKADYIDLPAGENPNSSSDDFSNALEALSSLLVEPTKVFVFENRKISGYKVVSNIILIGKTSITIDVSGSNQIALGGASNITMGSVTYSIKNSLQYASSQPDGYRSDGRWLPGTILYDSSPSAGEKIGWVVISSGSPDVIKPFGAIDS